MIIKETGRKGINGYVIFNNAINTDNPKTYMQIWNNSVSNPYKEK